MNKPVTSRRPLRVLRNSVLIILTAVAAAAALTGCSAGKQASGAKKNAPVPADVALQTPSQRFDALCAGYADWNDVSLPVKVTLTAPKRVSFSARASMKRGEWINISVRMLGFELASVWVDNDSVHAIDKYHKMYLSEGLANLTAGADVTLADLQDLLLGRGFLAGKNGGTFTSAMANSVELTAGNEGLFIVPRTKPASFDYGFILYPSANNLMATSVAAGENHAATVTYTDFADTPAGSFSSTADIAIVKGRNAAATLEWNFGSAKWNSGENRTWKKPSGYKRISADQLIKTLSSL